MADVAMRSARDGDLPALTELYNHYVRETAITFDVDPFTPEERRPWLDGFAETGPHRLVVAAHGHDLLGYACSHTFRVKPAYRTSVEVSVYLRPESAGHGIGTTLYEHLFASIAQEDLNRAYAGITLPNPASIALHRKFGFRSIGVFHEVGYKFGRYWDVEWMERPLP